MSGLSFERQAMVDRQLRQQGIHDERVLTAMDVVPRHEFVDKNQWTDAYRPRAVDIGFGQTISQPFMVGAMTQLLELEGHEVVLEVGTGSGYQAAVLSRLVQGVVTVECIPHLARQAARRLRAARVQNVYVVAADGSDGVPLQMKFDRIMVTAAAPTLDTGLLDQLADPGILVSPVGDRRLQELHVVRRREGKDEVSVTTPCRFVPLRGQAGWA